MVCLGHPPPPRSEFSSLGRWPLAVPVRHTPAPLPNRAAGECVVDGPELGLRSLPPRPASPRQLLYRMAQQVDSGLMTLEPKSSFRRLPSGHGQPGVSVVVRPMSQVNPVIMGP